MPQFSSQSPATFPQVSMGPSRGSGQGSSLEGYEIKSGKLLLQHRLGSRTVWLPVFVRVYRNAFEHFAVVSRQQAISAQSTYVNLRTSTCNLSEDCVTKFHVIQNNYEGTVITFNADNENVVSQWTEAFTCATPPNSATLGGVSVTLCPLIPRSPLMPPLPEVDEEE